jgi:hypothetical protein
MDTIKDAGTSVTVICASSKRLQLLLRIDLARLRQDFKKHLQGQ